MKEDGSERIKKRVKEEGERKREHAGGSSGSEKMKMREGEFKRVSEKEGR